MRWGGVDVVISDLDVLAPDPATTVESLGSRVLVYADRVQPRLLARLLRAGARGVVCRAIGIEDLHRALSEVVGGRLALERETQLALTAELLTAADDEPHLTAREREVLQLVERGAPTDAIATALHLSETTVKTHLKRSAAKLGTRGRSATVARALRLELL